MNEIKFSNNYTKLPLEESIATLEYVGLLRKENQTNAFLNYDTYYHNTYHFESKSAIGVAHGYYPLKKVDYLLLLFRTLKGCYFTTIRSKVGMYGRDKEEYYRTKVGQEFKIIIDIKPL